MTDFKPGTVVLLDFEPFSWNQLPKSDVVAIATNNGGWATQNGALIAGKVNNVRPLVVIDPEDREQANRLADAFAKAAARGRTGDSAMQAALRSLVAPPKPDEPKAVTAIVVDSGGCHWARGTNDFWYRLDGMSPGVGVRWGLVDAVRVLSEGVA